MTEKRQTGEITSTKGSATNRLASHHLLRVLDVPETEDMAKLVKQDLPEEASRRGFTEVIAI